MWRGALLVMLPCVQLVVANSHKNSLGDMLDQMPWVITKDQGTWPHDDIAIPDLQAFLQVAQLEEHLETLESEHGLHLDDVKEVTDEQLERLGVAKLMHRRRFLRYAKEMHVQEPVDPAGEQLKVRVFRLAGASPPLTFSGQCRLTRRRRRIKPSTTRYSRGRRRGPAGKATTPLILLGSSAPRLGAGPVRVFEEQ
eukprot:COSAG04_NODE_596_length_12255_cov_4.614018_8_plen_196_part_00